jgi:ATP-dependent Clp protease ATP-binding subunit ClpB
LSRGEVEQIVDIQLRAVEKMLSANGIRLEVSPSAREWVAQAGYDPMFGARPVKRTIQRYIINDLSKQILAGEVDRTRPIRIDASDAGLTFEN